MSLPRSKSGEHSWGVSGLTERLPLLRGRPVLRYTVALLLCLASLLLRWCVGDAMPPGYPFVTFFPAIIVCAFLFGPGAGVFAGTLCGLFAWYYFVQPGHSFALSPATALPLAFYAEVVAVIVLLMHWFQQANARLRAAREEGRRLAEESTRLAEESTRYAERAELLFQELQHRVGNNLQMIGAVLSLQLRGLQEPTARRAITDSVARLQVIGGIQRQLYRNNGELVPLDSFIADVTEQFMRSNGRSGVDCQISAASGLVLPPDAAVPIALILSEAIANAIEHGLAGRDEGRIHVTVEQTGGDLLLEVRDNGCGLPAGFDPSQSDSLGLRISRVLSQQLNAHYTLEPGTPGCTMRLRLAAERFLSA